MKKLINYVFTQKWYILFFQLFFIYYSSGHAQRIIKGPYLIEPGENMMIIRWETDDESSCMVKYGIDSTLKMRKNAVLRGTKKGGFLYEICLDGLKPGVMYFYKVKTGSSETKIKNFKTYVKNQKNIQFVAMGDSRSNPEIFQNVLSYVHSENPDLIISMGDLVENGGAYDQWDRFYFTVARELIDHVPLVSTLGDHEGDGDNGELFRYFLRTNQQTEKQWFSFDYGAAHFISLDYRHPDNEEMIQWFIEDMSSRKARWNFVYMHRPCYNLGGHRSTWGRDKWPELFRKYKVDIVFAGHSHQYERFYPIRPKKEPAGWPITYITTGGAGAGLYEVTQNPYLVKAESVNHHLFFEITGDTLQAKVFRNDNSLLDEFSIIKKHDYFDQKYFSLVKPQEGLDILTMFTSAISPSIEMLPLEEYPALVLVDLKSTVEYEIPFTIQLSENSAKYYQMDVFYGILYGKENKKIILKIYSRSDITISGWGSIRPELRLRVIYEDQSLKQVILGGTIDYWPAKEY